MVAQQSFRFWIEVDRIKGDCWILLEACALLSAILGIHAALTRWRRTKLYKKSNVL